MASGRLWRYRGSGGVQWRRLRLPFPFLRPWRSEPKSQVSLGCRRRRAADPGTFYQKVQETIGMTIRDPYGQRLFPSAQCRMVTHPYSSTAILRKLAIIPVLRRSRSLNINLILRQNWDRHILENRRTTGTPVIKRIPTRVLVKPDQQQTQIAKRHRVAGPVRRKVAHG